MLGEGSGFGEFGFPALFVGGDPVGGRRGKIVIEDVIEDGIEGAFFFGVGEDDAAEIFFRDEHDARDEANDSTSVTDEFAAAIILQGPTETIASKLGTQRSERRMGITVTDRKNGLRGPHFPGLFFAKEALVGIGIFTVVELERNPLGHFGDRRVDTAGGAGVIERNEIDGLQLAIETFVRGGIVVAGLKKGVAEIGGLHVQRIEDVLLDVRLPGLAGDGGDDLAGSHIKKIVVGIVAAKTGGGFHVAKFVDDFFASEGGVRPEEEVAFPKAHARAMREEIANGHFVGDVGVVHLKTGEAFEDFVVPGKFAGVDKAGESGGGESFGVGADAVERVFVDARGFAEFFDAETLGEDNLAVFDDGDGKAGDFEGGAGAFGVGGEIGGRSGRGLGWQKGRSEQDYEEKKGAKARYFFHVNCGAP